MASNLSGAHDPDKNTVGIPGQTYTNTITGDTWVCIAVCNIKAQRVNRTEYVWARVDDSNNPASNVIAYVESLDSSNKIPLRSLDSGVYILRGYFTAYNGDTNGYTFNQKALVSIGKDASQSYVQIFSPKNNTITYLAITDDSVEERDAELVNMESIANRVTDIDETSDDNHYPSAKSVYNALPKCGSTPPTAQTEGKVGTAYYVVVDNKVTAIYVCVGSTAEARTWAKMGNAEGGKY